MRSIKRIIIALLLTGCIMLCSCSAQTGGKSTTKSAGGTSDISQSSSSESGNVKLETLTESSETNGVTFGEGVSGGKTVTTAPDSGKTTTNKQKETTTAKKKGKKKKTTTQKGKVTTTKSAKKETTTKGEDGVVEMPVIPIN